MSVDQKEIKIIVPVDENDSSVVLNKALYDQYSKMAYDSLSEIVSGKLTTITIVTAALSLAETASTFDKLRGQEKKQVVLDTLSRFVENADYEQDEKLMIQLLLRTTVSKAIDSFIYIGKGHSALSVSVDENKQVKCSCAIL